MSALVKIDYREQGMNVLVDIIGGILSGVGIYCFAAAAKLPMVGTSGIALILYQLFHLPVGTMALALNIPIAIFTYRYIGRKYMLNSIRSMIITSVITDLVPLFCPLYTGSRLLAAICCSVLTGLGYAMIYMRNSSTGGVDFIVLAIRSRNPHMTIGTLSFVVDALVILIGVITVSRDVDSLIYGIISVYVLSSVVDGVMYGMNKGKMALIVTNHPQEMCSIIAENYDRGATIIDAKGGYSGEKRSVVMCACNSKQMYGIRKLIKEFDPSSFMMILESDDVVGEGFKAE